MSNLDDITQAFAPCEPTCPPFTDWPVRNLIMGTCPRCTRFYSDEHKLTRALRAKRLIQTPDGGPTDAG